MTVHVLPRLAHAAATRLLDESYYVAACARRGVLSPEPPWRLARMAHGLLWHGSLGGVINAAGLRYAGRTAVLDERGSLTYAELDAHANAIANGWLAHGFRPGEGIAILARNHRHFLEAFFAATKVGARIILLNTDFSGPQLRDVAAREGTDLLVHDEEYAELLAGLEPRRGVWQAWTEDPTGPPRERTLAHLVRHAPRDLPPRSGTEARLTVLTSGTTGTPKGAARSVPRSLAPVGALLGRVPFHRHQTMELCAPMFHSLGFATMMFGVTLGNTLVLRRRFDPALTLRSVSDRRSDSMVVVPVMLRRMVDHLAGLDAEARAELDLTSLRVILTGGSQLGTELCTEATETFGPVLYNLYGSTEVAYASVATPDDLRRSPATVGRVVRGSMVRIVDADGVEVPTGTTGRIMVGNAVQFEGYTGGGGKEVVDGLMSSGDVGHFDEHGLLYVDGRDDEMIVSGGENVFPREVEDLLEQHPAVLEAAVVGVDDRAFGQRLKAFVVLRPRAELTEADVQQFVRDNLARYKVPREVAFLEELPRNPTGKVLKKSLG